MQAVFFDVKVVDPAKHKTFTGVDNALILDNLGRMADSFPDLTVCVRTPIIPGFNDTAEDVGAILDFIGRYPRIEYELLP